MRLTNFTSMRAAAITLGACATMAACAKNDAATDTTAMGGMGASTGAMSGTTTTAAGGMAGDSMSMGAGGAMGGAKQMTDADIMAMVSAANQGEIAAGGVAREKGTNGDVKSYGADMVKEHTKMDNDGKAIGTKAGLQPNMAAADSIIKANQAMGKMLASAAKGMTFDTAYVNGQVMAHQNTLALVQAAAPMAQNADLKRMLTDATPNIQKHLERAREMQSKMGRPTT
jgi:putative membrane protein